MKRFAVLACVAILAAAAPAHAGGIVLETFTGDRPADAGRLLSPVLDELAGRGFAGGDTLARAYDGQVARAAMAGGLPADFAAQVDGGFKSFVTGQFDDAIKKLAPLVDAAHANAGAFMRDPSLLEPLQKALIGLAMAQQRTGDAGAARGTLGELARAFPAANVSRGTYGPEAAQLFEQVKRELAAQGKGKLVVKLADESGTVFVDENYRGPGSTTIDLAPGEYRICVMQNKRPSRSHRVTVRANSEATVAIDAGLDQAIHTVGWTGLAFTAEADRDAHEAAYAAKVANAINASAVAIVGIDQVKGRAALVGALVSLQSGREIRRASVALDPDPSTERLRALARFLAGDEPAAGLEVQLGGAASAAQSGDSGGHETAGGGDHDQAAPTGPTDRAHHRWKGWTWITGTIGLGGLVTGAVLVGLDGRCSVQAPDGIHCNDNYVTMKPGLGVLAGGAVFTGIAIYLFATQHGDAPSHTAYVAPTHGGAIAGFSTSW